MQYPFTEHFMREHRPFVHASLMGPNVLLASEELASALPITHSMRILDLACGTGLSSIFLAEKFGARVVAADLWIAPEDNLKRFEAFGLSENILPLSVDVTQGLPFAKGYFDLIFCVDAYHYFGTDPKMLPFLLSFLRKGGYLAVSVPGLKQEFPGGTPEELRPFLPEDANFHSAAWWRTLWEPVRQAEILSAGEMACHEEAWADWLSTSNPYAVSDRAMMKAEGGKYFAQIQLIARHI